jgi:hypothetical protein
MPEAGLIHRSSIAITKRNINMTVILEADLILGG